MGTPGEREAVTLANYPRVTAERSRSDSDRVPLYTNSHQRVEKIGWCKRTSGSPCLGGGSASRRGVRRTLGSDALRSHAPDDRPDLAVRAGGGAGLPRAGFAALVGP